MHNDFFDTVFDALRMFVDAGFEPYLLHWDGQSFGNGFVELKRRHLRIRVVRDRDHDFIWVSPSAETGRWTDPATILRVVVGEEASDPYLAAEPLAEAARLLFDNLDLVAAAMTKAEWPQTRGKVEACERETIERRFGFKVGPE